MFGARSSTNQQFASSKLGTFHFYGWATKLVPEVSPELLTAIIVIVLDFQRPGPISPNQRCRPGVSAGLLALHWSANSSQMPTIPPQYLPKI